METNVITDIESKTKATRYLTFQGLLFFIFYLMLAYIFRGYVHGLLFVPYMIFSSICCIFLLLPSSLNKQRSNAASLTIMFQADKAVYRPHIEPDYEYIEVEEE